MSIFNKTIKRLFFKANKPIKDDNLGLGDTIVKFNEIKPLYNKLIKKCHPDKFQDPVMKSVAEQLAIQININRFNYKKLTEIEKKINESLE